MVASKAIFEKGPKKRREIEPASVARSLLRSSTLLPHITTYREEGRRMTTWAEPVTAQAGSGHSERSEAEPTEVDLFLRGTMRRLIEICQAKVSAEALAGVDARTTVHSA